jgi:hypothetical protein
MTAGWLRSTERLSQPSRAATFRGQIADDGGRVSKAECGNLTPATLPQLSFDIIAIFGGMIGAGGTILRWGLRK